jgi:ABC-type multidrug transport system fused ATPase/permease subunit
MLAMHWGVVASSVGLLVNNRAIANGGDSDHANEGDSGHVGDDSEFAVSVRGLYKHALRGFDLDVRKGERVVIMGPIGCGKTTLLRCLMRLARPDAGRLFLHGVPYDNLSSDVVRESFAYIPQQPTLFDRSILDNVLYGSGLDGSKEPVRAAVWSAARRLGIADAIAALPDGFDTLAGKGGDTLSGGQRQMVWLLRAMMRRRPVVLLMDEPTAALDDASKQSLQAALDAFETVIIVSHDREFADAVATRVIRM